MLEDVVEGRGTESYTNQALPGTRQLNSENQVTDEDYNPNKKHSLARKVEALKDLIRQPSDYQEVSYNSRTLPKCNHTVYVGRNQKQV